MDVSLHGTFLTSGKGFCIQLHMVLFHSMQTDPVRAFPPCTPRACANGPVRIPYCPQPRPAPGLQLFEEYFATAYGLPKLDIVFTPRMMLGGMENWGLIFLNDSDTKTQGALLPTGLTWRATRELS